MANVIFKKVLPDSTYTAKQRYDALTKDSGTFYLVDENDSVTPIELYLGDVLLSANIAAEIGVEDVATYFTGTTVEAVLAELYEAQLAKTVYITEDSTSVEFAKVYSVYQGSAGTAADPVAAEKIADINIPKDLVVKSGSVVDIVFVEGTGGNPDSLHEGDASGPDVTALIKGTDPATEADAGKYIKLVIANNEATPLYIAAKSLVDIYTGGATAEATVAIDANNEITVTINKVAATKIIYAAASEAVYTVEAIADADEFALKVVNPGLYTESGGVYTKVQAGDVFDSGTTYYVLTSPAVAEETIKDRVDYVEDKVDDLAEYVGEIPVTSQATTVIGYVDERTGEGVGSLNSEAGVASVTSNVVTIKGGIVETEGLISNSVATAPATEVQGYYNPDDKKFYNEATFETEITPAGNTAYVDQAVGGKTYVWTGKAFAEVRADIVLEEVAVTGAAQDVSIADAGGHYTGTTVEAALQEIGAQLTWNEV